MLERFSDHVRRVVVLAKDEAHDLGHDYIGTEHLLLGLLHDPAGSACQVLAKLKITPEAVQAKVMERVTPGVRKTGAHVPFSPPAKKSLELSLREALRLGHHDIGSGHLLLGLLREDQGIAAQVLTELGVDVGKARPLVDETEEHTTASPGPRGFIASPIGKLTDRLRNIEDRIATIEARLSAIEDRLE